MGTEVVKSYPSRSGRIGAAPTSSPQRVVIATIYQNITAVFFS
jgi:hypothetical protein